MKLLVVVSVSGLTIPRLCQARGQDRDQDRGFEFLDIFPTRLNTLPIDILPPLNFLD